MSVIAARGLRKSFGKSVALDGVDLRVEEGRILGLIGPNGAGKTTALNAILGLIPYQGELKVLGRDPWRERDQLMRDVSFIADVAVLPRWMRVSQALDYVAGVHPRFDRTKAESFLTKTTIRRDSKVRELSKGMVTQLHLALIMAIDAKLLVLDEPTLGLDILFRKQFYDSLLTDYFDRNRTIVVTTHHVDEIQDVLTDVMFINRGRIVFGCSIEEFESRYWELLVNSENRAGGNGSQADSRAPNARPQHLSVRWCGSRATRRVWGRAQAKYRRLLRCCGGQPDRDARRRGSMNTQSNTLSGSFDARTAASAALSPTRPIYWSIRRELWESRSIYIAPLCVAAVFLFGFLISTISLPGKMRSLSALDPAHQRQAIAMPYDMAAGLLMLTAMLVGAFYCLDALHGERRNRSILFWKSLPVSESHHGALESKRSNRHTAAAHLCDHFRPAIDYAPAKQRGTVGERS